MKNNFENMLKEEIENVEEAIEDSTYHPLLEEIVNGIKTKTNVNDSHFFRIMTIYKIAQMISSMRVTVSYEGGQNLPLSIFVLALAGSGFSKGFSMGILQDEVFNGFYEKYKILYEDRKDLRLSVLAQELEMEKNISLESAEAQINKKFSKFPKFIYSAGSATTEGIRGLMSAFDMVGIGSVNLEIDEIGDQLAANEEALDILMIPYDKGGMKNKLRQTNSQEDIDGGVPTNLCMFGTPVRLLDGSKTEERFMSYLVTGYGRRLLYAYGDIKALKGKTKTAEERYDELVALNNSSIFENISKKLEQYADKNLIGQNVVLTKEANVLLLSYQNYCTNLAEQFKETQILQTAEMIHRYFRVLKLAGLFAVLDLKTTVEIEHIKYGITLAEDSGKSFNRMNKKEKQHVVIAKYLLDSDEPITITDMIDDLPFFRGSESARRDLLALAKDWGYKNQILITEKVNTNNITFYSGEKMLDTNLEKIRCSFSKHQAYNYKPIEGKWSDYESLLKSDFNYCVHHFGEKTMLDENGEENLIKGYRTEECVIEGFNLIVIDVDDGLPIEITQSILEEYEYMIGTTKSHTEENHRYRILLPMKNLIKLNPEEFKKFMENVFNFLPFALNPDTSTKDITRKWAGNTKALVYKNEGKLIDPINFIDGTNEEKQMKNSISKYSNLDKLERWIILNTEGRNNALIKIGLLHIDSGKTIDEAMIMVESVNSKFEEPLSEKEINNTVLKTVTKKYYQKNGDK